MFLSSHPTDSCGNRWMSPSSMTMPTMSSWSNYDQPPTPQGGPPQQMTPMIGQQQQPQQQQQGPPQHLQPGQGPRPLPPNHTQGMYTSGTVDLSRVITTDLICEMPMLLLTHRNGCSFIAGAPLTPHSNSGSSDSYFGPGLSPSFPPSSTPDFLSSLAHLGDNISAPDIGNVDKRVNQTGGSEPLNHPPRPNSSALDSQVSQPLRHPTPGTPCGPPSVNPQTPQSMPPVCSSAAGNNGNGSSSASVTATCSNTTTTSTTNNHQSQASNSSSTMSTGDNMSINNQLSATSAVVNSDLGPCNDLNFDPMAVIDGEGQGQEGLNVSLAANLCCLSLSVCRCLLCVLSFCLSVSFATKYWAQWSCLLV